MRWTIPELLELDPEYYDVLVEILEEEAKREPSNG
jgi:hypothetical protein